MPHPTDDGDTSFGSDDSPTDSASDEVTRESVDAALERVVDPDLGGSVLEAGVVEAVDVTDGTVTIDATFAGFDAEAADLLGERIRSAIMELPGVDGVHLHDETTVDQRTTVPGVDRVIAVASAKGGVGKTTVATQLARGLAATGESVGLFDADIYGPNVPDLLGVSGPLESTDDGAAKPLDADGLQVVSVGLIANDEPLAWRGAMANEAVEELLTDAAWDVDTLVIDLPPGTGDIVLTALQSFPIDGTVLVTTPFPTAAADTQRSATLFREEGVPLVGTVLNMAGFTCPTCGDEHAPFGDDPDLDTPVLAELPIDEELRAADGDVPDDIRDLAAVVTEELDAADALEVPPQALDLRGVPERARREQVTTEFQALAAGESLFILSDEQPRSLRTAVEGVTDCEPAVTTAKQGPGRWAIRFSKHTSACQCGEAHSA